MGLSALLLTAFFAVGVIGLQIAEPGVGWARGVQWVIGYMVTQDSDLEPTSAVSRWFQVGFGVMNFVLLTLSLSTIVIPPILGWWESRINGRGSISRWDCLGKRLFLVVGPVDWEKVESLMDEMARQNLGDSLVVVVSDDEKFPNLPDPLLKKGVGFVRGNLRDHETYARAGINYAAGVYVCASSYDGPAQDAKGAAIVAVIEGLRPEIITIAELVSCENDDLFRGRGFSVDATVAFDPETLKAIAQRVADVARGGRISVEFSAIDDAQASELNAKLAEAGVIDCGDGNVIRIILPVTLDDTSADYAVWATLQRAEAAGEQAVALFLSIKSEGLFAGNPNASCADRVMAMALVAAMSENLRTI